MCAGAGKCADVVYVKAHAFSHISLRWIAATSFEITSLFLLIEIFVQIAQADVFMQNGRLAYRSS